MRELAKLFHICGIRLRQSMTDPKSVTILIVVPLIVWSVIQPVVDMSIQIGQRVTIVGLVFVLSDMYGVAASLLFSLGTILLFSDAPFLNEQQLQCMVRCKTRTWIGAQLLSIIALSALYTCYWALSMALVILQNGSCEIQWGTVWNTLARTNAASQFGVALECSFKLIRQYNPAESLLLSLALKFMYCCFIGNVCFCFNLFMRANMGNLISVFFAMQDFLAINSMGYNYTWFSPATLSRLSALDPSKTFMLPSPMDALLILGGSACVLGVLAICFGRKRMLGGCI